MSVNKPITINNPLDISECITMIDIVHHKIHEGMFYSTSYYEKVGPATAINILLTVGSKSIHFIGEAVTDNPGILTFSKNPNITTGTSVLTCFNNNGNSSNTTNTILEVGGAYTSSGTILKTYLFGSSSGTGGNKVSIGSSIGEREEAILPVGGKYLLRFVADSASTRTIIRTSFYEQDW